MPPKGKPAPKTITKRISSFGSQKVSVDCCIPYIYLNNGQSYNYSISKLNEEKVQEKNEILSTYSLLYLPALNSGNDENTTSVDNALVINKASHGNSRNNTSSTVSRLSTVSSNKPEKPKYDKDVEKKFEQMIAGDLTDLPPLPRSIVRIFLSSTFSDTHAERNILSSKVFPQLREYCYDIGLDFQVVDLRWGVVDQAQNDHSATKICLQEIENCQRVSLGPNFIAFVSHRYGGQPLPTELTAQQFEMINSEIIKLDLKDGELFSKWFQLDENNLPPNYVLQNVTTYLPHFGDLSYGNETEAEKDAEIWKETLQKLKKITQLASVSLFKKTKFSAEEKHTFFKSVTESEIENGILKNKNSQQQTLFYQRKLIGLKDNLENKVTQKYIECINTDDKVQVNEETEELLESLIHERVEKVVGSQGIKIFNVMWNPDGIDPDNNKEHKKYLTQFCDTFTSDVINLIAKAKHEKENKIRQSEYYSRFDEILHHLKFCLTKCETFCGQRDILNKAKDYILDDSNRKPLVISAESGAGKTSLMAMIMKNLKKWINSDHIGIIRFLGTSPDTINIYNVLRSVCGQIADNADTIMEPVAYKKMSTLVGYIPRFLRSMSTKLRKPVVILLDSIDQLTDEHDVFSMSWLPLFLPPNIKIIISTLPKEHGILKNLQKVLIEPDNFLEVPILPPETGKEIIEKYLSKKKRQITMKQMVLLLSQFNQSPTPLYLKLLLDEASTWASYTLERHIKTTSNIQQAIHFLFDELEKKFGGQLIKSALGFITVGFNGLSEIELEDALSCDNYVLDEVYRYHDPPVPNMIRIPPVLWARIRFEIQEYLVERLSQGKTTVFWYHRQFIEAATNRYVTGNDKYTLHKTLFELFSAENGVYKDIHLNKRNLLIKSADRQVAPQVLSGANPRKLECMLHHINHGVHIISIDTAKQSVFCNLNFIHAFINCYSTARFIEECEAFLQHHPDEEIKKIQTFFDENKTNVKSKPVLAGNLLLFINPTDTNIALRMLLENCKKLLQNHDAPVLMPTFPCLSKRKVRNKSQFMDQPGKLTLLASAISLALFKRIDGAESILILYNSLQNTMTNLDLNVQNSTVATFSPSENKLAVFTGDDLTVYNTTNLKHRTKSLKSLKVNKLFFNSDSTHLGYLTTNNHVTILKLKDLSTVTTFKPDDIITNIICTEEPDLKTLLVCQDKSGNKSYLNSRNKKGTVENEKTDLGISNCQVLTGIHADYQITCWESNINIYKVDDLELLFHVDLPSTEDSDIGCLLTSLLKPQVAVWQGRRIVFLDITTGKFQHKISHDCNILSCDLSSDGDLFVMADETGQITLYNTNIGKIIYEVSKYGVPIQTIKILEENILVLDLENELKIMNYKNLTIEEETDCNSVVENELLNEIDVVSIAVANCGEILITSHEDGNIKLWNLSDAQFVTGFNKSGSFDKMLLDNADVVLGLNTNEKSLDVFHVMTGEDAFQTPVPQDVIAMSLSEDRKTAYLLSKSEINEIHVLDLVKKNLVKSMTVQKLFDFISIEIFISMSNRFLVLKAQATDTDRAAIEYNWKKGGNTFSSQRHPYRLAAVDITSQSGTVLQCFRQMTKVPSLCETAISFKGNLIMFAARRHAIFWDIPTGKCDQQMSKGSKRVMIYRPDWAGKGCRGHNTCFLQSPNKKWSVVGSQDGYVINYSSDTGLPIDMRCPTTKHSAEVSHIGISPDGKWVVSVCLNGVIKLWSPDTGLELYSVSTKHKVHQLFISANSQYLVLKTQPPQSRLLIFKKNY